MPGAITTTTANTAEPLWRDDKDADADSLAAAISVASKDDDRLAVGRDGVDVVRKALTVMPIVVIDDLR